MWGTFKSLQDFMRFLIRWLLLLTILLEKIATAYDNSVTSFQDLYLLYS